MDVYELDSDLKYIRKVAWYGLVFTLFLVIFSAFLVGSLPKAYHMELVVVPDYEFVSTVLGFSFVMLVGLIGYFIGLLAIVKRIRK